MLRHGKGFGRSNLILARMAETRAALKAPLQEALLEPAEDAEPEEDTEDVEEAVA